MVLVAKLLFSILLEVITLKGGIISYSCYEVDHEFNNWLKNNNLLLTEREGRTGVY